MPVPLLAAAALGCCSVSGSVASVDGVPLRAHVHAGGTATADADSDAAGGFRLQLPAGRYRVVISAPGYAPAITDVVVHDGERLDVALEPAGAGKLREIGRISVDGRLAPARSTVPSREISRADLTASGYDRAVDALATLPSVTLVKPGGGAPGAPAVVALRGPDPSETRIALDGQPLNDANTGDLDLALFPSAVLGAVEVSEGLGPEDHRGADTIGGEVNLVSLRPTATPQRLLRLSAGSFGTSTIDAGGTGRIGRLGYALAAGSARSDGDVHDYPVTFSSPQGSTTAVLGSRIAASTALVHLTYDLSPRATLRLRSFTLADTRDLSASETAPLDPRNEAPYAPFAGSGPLTRAQTLHATLIGATLPLGAGSLSATSAFSRSVNALAGGIGRTPYDFSLADRSATTTLEWSRSAGASTVALGGSTRSETLSSPDQFGETLREHATSAWLRGGTDLSARAHVAASIVTSRWSTFGTSTDGRIGLTVDDGSGGTFRVAAGTGFRAPLLAERYTVPFAQLPPPDEHCVSPNGNPNERAEHATEYELGYGKRFGATTLDATLYRTNLRDPIENFYPLGARCGADPTVPVAQSVPINAGNVVYQGGSLRVAHRFGSAWFATAEYGVNAAYPVSLPAAVSAANPTSGSDLVVGQQFAGIPLQRLTFGVRYARDGAHGALNLAQTSANNWLAQGRYATLDAAIGKRMGGVDVTLAGTNLTNAVSGRFTRIGEGTPYPIPDAAPQSRDALVLQPAALRIILTFASR